MLRARRREWQISVRRARHHIGSLLKESSGLLSRIDEIFAQAYESGRDNALLVAELPDSAISEMPPWTFEQVIDDRFVPKRERVKSREDKVIPCRISRFGVEVVLAGLDEATLLAQTKLHDATCKRCEVRNHQ